MIRVFAKFLESNEYKNAATPITMHKSTLLVQKRKSPKYLKIFSKDDDVGLVIVDGAHIS
jgi:hypothetical protein